ncbi:MAG: nuclear transport factor 2 family protein [Gemmatimonadota bacterium]
MRSLVAAPLVAAPLAVVLLLIAPLVDASLFVSALHAQASQSAPAAEREIRRLRESSNEAIAKHDTAGIAAIFAPNVVVVASISSKTVGRDANARSFAEIFSARPGVTYRRVPEEVQVWLPWRMASERGRWTGTWTDSDGRISIGGVYFAKWRQLDGAWKVESETYVPDRCQGGKYCAAVP